MTLLSDADGAAVTTGKEWLERIIAQVAAPVRWDLCMRTMADLGVTAIIELPPAGTLTGLARRALPGVAQLAIKTPDQLDAARELIAEHLADDRPSHARRTWPRWRIVVSPTAGTFRSGETGGDAPAVAAGATVPAGAVLGNVLARGGQQRGRGTVAGGDHRMAGGGRRSGQRGPATGPCRAEGERGCSGARILRSAGTSRATWSPTMTSPPSSTRTTSGSVSRVGIVSRRIADPTRA